ncbi:MAG: acetylornithine transaminase [Nitrospirae bacterium]|nr:acetylornithine transaminase [Nitrospirota bacterium]
MDTKRAIEDASTYLMNTYNRYPILLRKGRGMKVWSADGNEYLDFVGGIAVNVLGHCHPKVVVAIQKQAQRLLHVSNFYHIEPQIELAKLLVEHSFADKVFFCNSGAEANEAGIKLARKYAKEALGPDKFEFISAQNSFHGRTLATLSAGGQEKFQKGFEPMMPGFRHVPFNDISQIEKAITPKTCGVLLEPIQGEGGVNVPHPEYLSQVRQLCNERKLLFILDEVQTGMGRTGKLFAYEHYGITPDIMTLAKGLGGGVPIGAMLASKEVSGAFKPALHGTTFGGNPLVCAAGITVLNTILEDGFILEQCVRMGEYLIEKLNSLKKDFPSIVVDVRGKGLLVGMEITKEGGPIVNTCMQRGVLINFTAGNILRFMPPLIVQKKDIDQLANVLEEVFHSLQRE